MLTLRPLALAMADADNGRWDDDDGLAVLDDDGDEAWRVCNEGEKEVREDARVWVGGKADPGTATGGILTAATGDDVAGNDVTGVGKRGSFTAVVGDSLSSDVSMRINESTPSNSP